jgi:hypothetical protein
MKTLSVMQPQGRRDDECDQCLEISPLLMPVRYNTAFVGADLSYECLRCRMGYDRASPALTYTGRAEGRHGLAHAGTRRSCSAA